ncbi:MAG: hypothetical protein C4523_17770 [Myxococcales bacterium]|nr:MAG: hypothetical protein C4523_17770 [Myxococcales bacterium]
MSDNGNTNKVRWDDHEQLLFDDLARMQTDAGRHLMDLLLTMHQGFYSDSEPIPAVLGGFDVIDTPTMDRSITIGEGIGFCFERVSGDDDGESRARLIQIPPARVEGETAGKTIAIPENTGEQPCLVLIYATPARETVMQEPRHRLNPTTGVIESFNAEKWTIASAELHTETGESNPIPTLPSAWNPLVGPVETNRLLLYAVYCPPAFSTLERALVLDLRFRFNPASGYWRTSEGVGNIAKSWLDPNPCLQTPYLSSQDAGSDQIEWRNTWAEVDGQRFYIFGLSAYNPWASLGGYYCPDETILDDNNRFSRPIYWYALPPIGLPIFAHLFSPTNPPLAARYGIVTCLGSAPDIGNVISHTFTLRCGNDMDKKYKVRTNGLFMGSLVVGQNISSQQRIYGCRRDGDKVMFTERKPMPDDVEFILGFVYEQSGYGIPLGVRSRSNEQEVSGWDHTTPYQFNLHKTPLEGEAACVLSTTAREITLGALLKVDWVPPQPPEGHKEVRCTLLLFFDDSMDEGSGVFFNNGWSLCNVRHLCREYNETSFNNANLSDSGVVHFPFPLQLGRKLVVRTKGGWINGMRISWGIRILGYSEPLTAI